MPIRIVVDTREKPHAISAILSYFEKHQIDVIRRKLDTGDYMTDPPGNVSVDRKQNLLEVVKNVCQQHKRFSAECVRAKEAGIRLVILVEHGGKIRGVDSVKDWNNPRLSTSPYAVSGARLHHIMLTYQHKYGVQWEFCDKRSTGKRIAEILAKDGEQPQV